MWISLYDEINACIVKAAVDMFCKLKQELNVYFLLSGPQENTHQ